MKFVLTLDRGVGNPKHCANQARSSSGTPVAYNGAEGEIQVDDILPGAYATLR